MIVAQRHIHMSPLDALILRVSHGDKVSVAINGDERRLIFDNVAVRVSPDMRLEMHIDTDEANAAGADNPPGICHTGDLTMNNELLQRIIEEVVSRLKKRAESTLTLSVAQLREINSRTVCCQYSSLHLQQVDLPLLEQIAEGCPVNMSVVTIHDALACGVRVKISLQHRLLPAIPVKKLARLPLEFSDELGRIIFLHPEKLLSYADVAQLRDGVLVLRRRCVVTALAQEAVSLRNVQLIKQE